MRIKVLFFILLTLISYFEASAQENTRIEIEIKPGESQPEIIPINNKGFILFNPVKFEKEGKEKQMKLSFYNTGFAPVWEEEVASSKKLNLVFYEYFENYFYLLFNSSSQDIMEIIKVDPLTGKNQKFEFYSVKGTTLTDFVVHEENIYIAGSIKKTPIIQKLNIQSNKAITLPSIVDGKNVQVTELFIDDHGKGVSAVISSSFDRSKNVIIRTFGSSQNKFKDLIIKSEQSFDFHTAKISHLENNVKLIMGSYGYRKSNNSQGFYMAKFVNDKQAFLKFYSFTDLNNFFAFMPEKSQEKLEEKAKRKKQKGKDLKIQYRLLMHKIEKQNNRYIMIGEAYYKAYRRESYSYFYAGRRFYDTKTVFDGNQFTHAVVAGFKEDGEILWDHSFKIANIKTFNLKEKVKTYVAPNEVTLFYNRNGIVRKLDIKNNEVVNKETMLTVSTGDENEKVKKASIGAAEYWYDNYFIAWGYQRIKNKNNKDVKKKRNIFYINKMSF